MTTLTPKQIAGLAMAELHNEGRAITAVAIALAESGGVTDVVSATGDYGVWQINARSHPTYSTSRLLSDPAYNAKAMGNISANGTNWRPWSTAWETPPTRDRPGVGYLSQAAPYWEHYNTAIAAVGGKDVGPSDIPGIIVGGATNPGAAIDVAGQLIDQFNPLDALRAVAALLGNLTSWETWRRVLYVTGGGLMFAAGLALLGVDLAGVVPSRKAAPEPGRLPIITDDDRNDDDDD